MHRKVSVLVANAHNFVLRDYWVLFYVEETFNPQQ